ncbi:uncharacterized protein [Dysidea avara]|uniref:uncharacterized protein isoform X3 n=1 Tax=Dysidea avara TaxID=196820 RepID=UPI003331CC68
MMERKGNMNTMMRIPLITLITSFLIMLVTAETGFKDPEVALTCSSEPTNNIVSVTWSPVHEDHDSVADILKSVKFQYCKVEIHCENEYDKVVNQCSGGKVENQVYEWRSVPKSENFCSVTVKYRDFYDSDRTVLSKKKNCYFEIAPYDVNITGNSTYPHGSQLQLHCSSEGGPQLEYSWSRTNTLSNDTTTNTNNLTISNVTALDGGNYTCTITNDAGSSNNTVTVYVGPVFTTHPMNQEEVINDSFTLQCTAEGFPTPSIQWYLDNTMITNSSNRSIVDTTSMNSITSILRVIMADFTDTGLYHCEANSSVFVDNVNSDMMNITVVERPVVTPSTHNVSLGTSITFECTEFGSSPFTYQWFMRNTSMEESDKLLVGEDKNTYNISSVLYNHTGLYFCEASNMLGILSNSTPSSLIVRPSIIEHPVTIQSVYPGEMVNLSCRAEGFSTLSYSWFMVESGSNIVVEIGNTTNPTYTITNPIYNQNNTGYYCVATNNEGIAVSNTSTLIVSPKSSSLPTTTSTPSILVITIVMSSTIIVTIVIVIIICGAILLRNWNRETKQSSKKLPNWISLVGDDYYSVVGTDEPSICEDIEGISLQDDTADGNKEEYKAITDYNLLLRSILYPKLTIDFKRKYKESSQDNFHEIVSAESSPGPYIHVKDSLGNPAHDYDDNQCDTAENGSTPQIVGTASISENEGFVKQISNPQQKFQVTSTSGEYFDETSTFDQTHNFLSEDSGDLVGQYIGEQSSLIVRPLSANAILADHSFSLQQSPRPISANEDYTFLNSNSEQFVLSDQELTIEQGLQPTLASGEYVHELTATAQTFRSSNDENHNDISKQNVQSTSATGEYTELSTGGKFISSSEQILSQPSSNDTLSTHIPTSLQGLRPTLATGEYLDRLSTTEQILSLQRSSTNGAQNLDVINSNKANGNPVSVINTLMLCTQQELPLKVNKNGYVEETKV